MAFQGIAVPQRMSVCQPVLVHEASKRSAHISSAKATGTYSSDIPTLSSLACVFQCRCSVIRLEAWGMKLLHCIYTCAG